MNFLNSFTLLLILYSIKFIKCRIKENISLKISENSLCNKVDEVVQFANKRMFVFSDEYYWEISEQFIVMSSPKFIQNYWGNSIEIPLDAVFTFGRGRFVDKAIFIKDKKWWRVTADGHTEASNTIEWKEWPNVRLDAAFNINFKNSSSDNPIVCFLFGSKYSIYKFGSDAKAMLTPTPVVVFRDAISKNNRLDFITNDKTGGQTISDLMKVTASMNTIDGKFIYLFGQNEKYCKIDTNDMICDLKKTNYLFKCDKQSFKPEPEEEIFTNSVNSLKSGFLFLKKFPISRISIIDWILIISYL